jgi:uncharacterized protein (UPF0332 family)
LEYHFVFREEIIKTRDIDKIKSAKRLAEKYVNKMWAAKSKRNTAQYKANIVIIQKDALSVYKNAVDFVNTLENIVRETD